MNIDKLNTKNYDEAIENIDIRLNQLEDAGLVSTELFVRFLDIKEKYLHGKLLIESIKEYVDTAVSELHEILLDEIEEKIGDSHEC